VNILRRKIIELRILIRNIQQNPGAIDDIDFRYKLRIVNETVVRLLEDARRLSGRPDGPTSDQINAINIALTDIMISINTITENIYEGSRGSHNAEQDANAAERAINEADRILRTLELLIEIEGKNALQQARDAQGRLGQQSIRLTEMANEARVISIRQESESITIEITSRDALNTSEEALRIAQGALQQPGQVSIDIIKIRRQVEDASRMYDETKALADNAQKKAQDTYKESLTIYTEISSIHIIITNISSISIEVNRLKDDAARIKEEANRLIDEHRKLISEIHRQTFEANILIQRGTREQQKADELLADADAARDMARKAVEKAENLLREANSTLQILLEFDQKVRDSRAGAEEAMKKIPLIEQYIRQAEDQTARARENLQDAERDAIAAKEIALTAQIQAERAIQEITLINEETTITKHRSEELSIESDQLLADVEGIERRLQALERQADQDALLAQEALTKADQAKTSALSSSTKVRQALITVNEILRQLANLERIDIDKLTALEQSLIQVEQTLISAGIDVRYAELEKLYIEMSRWVFDYSNQLIVLTHDVENIRQINVTIPRTCFKKVQLEPTNPTYTVPPGRITVTPAK